jgi:hypothetical protein
MTAWICITCKERCNLKVAGKVEEMPDLCNFKSARDDGKVPNWLRKV